MRIKRLEICGFKSFVDRTVLTFDDPITGVVGPNGCGKSNIVDAIRWVMGEQSAKHLRGRAMEDVIFNGSESRGPAGMAEVSVTFDTHALSQDSAPGGVPWGAVGPSEVVVTRRLYRGGESEYLLGSVPCRLRDIVEFFLGTGVGSKAYAIIEQGRIGFIVSSRPEDRRTLIDEAAGITKYKAKKKIAERRMDATRQHLLRVSDIISEIETRLRSLKLQAQKAERYKRYKSELKNLELTAATQKHLGLAAESKCLAVLRTDLNERLVADTSSLRGEEVIIEAERLALATEMAELSTAKDELFSLNNRAQLSAQKAEHYQEESGMLVSRAEHARRELEVIAERSTQSTLTLTELETQVSLFDEEAESRVTALVEIERTYAEARSELVACRRQLDEAIQSASAAKAQIARLETEVEGARVRSLDLSHRLEELGLEKGQIEESVLALETEVMLIEERVSTSEEQSQMLETKRAVLDEHILSLREEVARGEIELETLREEAHRRRSRLQSLAEIQDRYESFQRGVRAIMQRVREKPISDSSPSRAAESLWTTTGVRGLVADIVQPPPDLETALEAVLGERLGNIIVESHDVGVEAIDYLKQQSEGRSSFIPLALRSSQSLGDSHGLQGIEESTGVLYDGVDGAMIPSVWPTGDGIRGPMLELIGYDRNYDGIASYLLGDVLVVEDLRQALALWRKTQTQKTLVTLDGEVIDPHGVVTGGSRESAVAGVLSQKREMRELEEIVAKLELDYQATLDRHIRTKKELTETLLALEENRTSTRQTELATVTSRKDLEGLNREHSQRTIRKSQLAASLESIQATIDQNESRWRECTVELLAGQESVCTYETMASDLRQKVEHSSEEVDRLMAELSTVKVSAAQASDRKRNARESMQRLQREISESNARRQRLEDESRTDQARAESLRIEAEQQRSEAALLQIETTDRSHALGERQSTIEERNGALARREADLKSIRSDVSRRTQELSTLDLRYEQNRMRLESLDEQIRERYPEVSKVSHLIFDYHLHALSGDAEDHRIRELRGLVERMGDINLTAIEEAEESQKRFDFLTTQKADLESAISQLESAIEKINRASRKRFREVFDSINVKFQEVFPNLFGGGRAHLALTDENDMLETGVEIVANPPGKKLMQNIELLSGGEKALTAVSLLFAIFLVKPSPFCVLDEVDAPLDEANVGRFNSAVREMTDRSQFIIVTHNQRTMETADRLCGVTMEESGVSKLVAVNLRGKRRVDEPRKTASGVHAPSNGEEQIASA
jgi:chromosome segregation protein